MAGDVFYEIRPMSQRSKREPAPRKRTSSTGPKRGESPAPSPIAKQSGLTSLYRPMFNKIDVDRSGFIDSGELHTAMQSLFPGVTFTAYDVAQMLAEADLNEDGVISLEEFAQVMTAAEGKSTLWGKAQSSMWGRFNHHTAQTLNVLHTTAAPLKLIARTHSYRSGDMLVASVGLRIGANIVAMFVTSLVTGMIGGLVGGIAIANGGKEDAIIGISFILQIVMVSFIQFIHLLCYFNGQTFPMFLMDLQMVDAETGKPYGFILFFCAEILFSCFLLLEPFFLVCTGKTISQRIMGAEIVVMQKRRL